MNSGRLRVASRVEGRRASVSAEPALPLSHSLQQRHIDSDAAQSLVVARVRATDSQASPPCLILLVVVDLLGPGLRLRGKARHAQSPRRLQPFRAGGCPSTSRRATRGQRGGQVGPRRYASQPRRARGESPGAPQRGRDTRTRIRELSRDIRAAGPEGRSVSLPASLARLSSREPGARDLLPNGAGKRCARFVGSPATS